MNNWIKVKDCLPPPNEFVLVLLEAYFDRNPYNPDGFKKILHEFIGEFNPENGWHILHAPNYDYSVKYWQKRLELPNETKV